MVCSSQYRQRQIWTYHAAPSSSKPSCRVSSTQLGQKRWSRSGSPRSKVLLGPARLATADQSAKAAMMRCHRLVGVRRVKPLRRCGKARPTRSRTLRRVKGEEPAIIVSSWRRRYRGINHANRICALCSARNPVSCPDQCNCTNHRRWNCSIRAHARSSAIRGTPSHRWRARSWWCSARGWSTCGSRS